MKLVLLAIAGMLLLVLAAGHHAPTDPDADARDLARITAEQGIKNGLRDPASAVFSDEIERKLNGTYVVCGMVNARNGFGGMAGRTPFVWDGVDLLLGQPETRAFQKRWLATCVAPEKTPT